MWWVTEFGILSVPNSKIPGPEEEKVKEQERLREVPAIGGKEIIFDEEERR